MLVVLASFGRLGLIDGPLPFGGREQVRIDVGPGLAILRRSLVLGVTLLLGSDGFGERHLLPGKLGAVLVDGGLYQSRRATGWS